MKFRARFYIFPGIFPPTFDTNHVVNPQERAMLYFLAYYHHQHRHAVNVIVSETEPKNRQHVGKTTASLGIISGLRKRFKNVGFIKPVGQQHERTAGGILVDKVCIVP